MQLGFKDQFVPYVESGSKRHTIRAGDRWKAGMRADLYARPRQKGMRLLFRAIVTRVQTIDIVPPPEGWKCSMCGTGKIHCHDVWSKLLIDGVELTAEEADDFAFRDGFRTPFRWELFGLMMGYWRGRLPFTGQILHWDYERRFMSITETCFEKSHYLALRGVR